MLRTQGNRARHRFSIVNKDNGINPFHNISKGIYVPILTRKGWGGAVFVFLLLFSSCAKMGQPDGGWYDEEPPKIVSCHPADKGIGVTSRKIAIQFDEFIKVDNPTEKVVISPPQIETPEIKAAGKRIVVDIKDSLKANTTYTVDFSDAISDNNEENPLGNYTYTFSTGDHIDTLEVAGTVLNAEDLEPIKGILVGLYRLDGYCFHQDSNVKSVADGQSRTFYNKGYSPGQLPHLRPARRRQQLYVQPKE